jgi:CheY-like chemotaxis protein/K+-sensing histidine kinase KdpD
MLGQNPSQAESGMEALKLLQKKKFDAILLDIMMPEMDGYQVLTHIRQNKNTQHLPVIMITAIDDSKSVEQCIENGADDYLVKPFNPSLLRARLEGCLARKRIIDLEKKAQLETERLNRELEEKVKEKTKELYFAYKKLSALDKAKSDFIKVISHELRTPLTGFGCIADLLFEESGKSVNSHLYKAYKETYNRLSMLVEQAILLANIEVKADYTCVTASVKSIIEDAIEKNIDSKILFNADSAPDAQFLCDVELLTVAFRELISTAIKLCDPGKPLKINIAESYGKIIVSMDAEGQGLPDEFLPVFFEPMQEPQMLAQDKNWGLAPVVASKIVGIFSGKIEISKKKDGSGILISTILQSQA